MQYLYKFEAMTTPCEVLIYASDKSKADSVAQKILLEAKRLEKKYNYFNPSSILSQLNARTTQTLDTETKSLLQRAVGYARKTQGVFDITIATIKDLYRETTSLKALEKQKEALLTYVGTEHLSIKKNKLYFDNPYTKIDLGGFVKEYAVDQAVKILRRHKITSALVNFGGDLYALGKKTDGKPFRVGIKDPHNSNTYARFVEIENEALTTSASYERHTEIEGKRFSHILSTKQSTESPASVTVISESCVHSGVFSTALMIRPDLAHNERVIML